MIVHDDVMAIGLLSRLTAYGVAVPAEISVIGFDDVPFVSMITPTLTTVRIPRARAGRAAVDYLHALLTAHPDDIRPPHELTTELAVRGTSARAR